MKTNLINEFVSKNTLITIFLILIFNNCDPNSKNSDDKNPALFSLLIAANTSTNSQDRVPVTSCNISKSTPVELTQNISVTNTIKNKDLCYFSFIAPTTNNYTITLTPSSNVDNLSSDSDLAANPSSDVGGNKPTNFWTGTGAECTNFGWQNCVHNTGLTVETITSVITAGQQIAIGVYGFDCSILDGCKFSIRVN